MSGKIKEIIDHIINERSNGNPAVAEITKAKLILKGINPDRFYPDSEDDPAIIEKLIRIAGQLNVKIKEFPGKDIIYAYSKKYPESETVSEIKNSLGGFGVKMLVYFASSVYKAEKIGRMMQDAFPDSAVFGCSTAGEIISGELMKDSVVAMAFSSNVVQDIKIAVVENLREGVDIDSAFTSFQDHFNENPASMDINKYIGLLLIDGMSLKAEEMMDAIGNRTDVFFVGGAAGDDLRHSKVYVSASGKAYTDSAVLALMRINDNAKFSIIKTHSFKILDKVLTATKVDSAAREVIEFNNRPALKEYAEAVGAVSVTEAPLYFVDNPIGLVIGENDILVRSPIMPQGTGIVFYCNIVEGMELRLLQSIDMIEDTRKALAKNILANGHIDGLLQFNCIARTRELEKKKLEKEYGRIFSGFPTAGFSTYGEEYLGHINQTAVMLAFRINNK